MNDEMIETPKKRLLDDNSYEQITEAIQTVKEKTDITLSMRKIINALITPESIEKITNEFIKKYE